MKQFAFIVLTLILFTSCTKIEALMGQASTQEEVVQPVKQTTEFFFTDSSTVNGIFNRSLLKPNYLVYQNFSKSAFRNYGLTSYPFNETRYLASTKDISNTVTSVETHYLTISPNSLFLVDLSIHARTGSNVTIQLKLVPELGQDTVLLKTPVIEGSDANVNSWGTMAKVSGKYKLRAEFTGTGRMALRSLVYAGEYYKHIK